MLSLQYRRQVSDKMDSTGSCAFRSFHHQIGRLVFRHRSLRSAHSVPNVTDDGAISSAGVSNILIDSPFMWFANGNGPLKKYTINILL